jgi:protease I
MREANMRIACVLAEGFEDSELKVPYDELRKAGHEVVIIGAKKGETLTGAHGKEEAEVDLGIDEANPDQFDALFIPGGYSPDKLRADDRFVRFTRAFADKPILAICHGPQLLITAGMVNGRRMTAWKTVQVDLRNADAEVVDDPVVVDGNLVTSRQPQDIPKFVHAALELLRPAPELQPSA